MTNYPDSRRLNSLTLSCPAVPPGRVPVIDELRGLAILLVITYHVCGVTGFPNKEHGELGVDVFVLLSGAALALTHRSAENAGLFLWRRLARLLPAYWIALTLFWQGGVHWLGRTHTPTDIWSHYFCIHPWWGDRYFMSICDSFWFLGLIVPLYLVYAALRRFLADRLDIVLGVGLMFSFALACWTFFYMAQPSVFVQLGLRPPLFFLGVVFGAMLRTGQARLPLTPWLGLGVLLSLYGMFVGGILIGYTVAGFSIFVAYYATRANAEAAGRRWLCRGLGWIGVYSYEIFLLHQPLIREYNHYAWNRWGQRVPNELELALGIAVALVVTLILSMVLHHLAGFLGKLISPRLPAARA
jgi:peptidoglycan/LPS O-acetylase OafA/YrhL